MKALFLALMLVPVFAHAKANVFCKNDSGKVLSALSEDGHFGCAAALAQGEACFTGPRAEVIAVINGNAFNWDEEWIDEASYKGKGEIAYTFVDGPNGTEDRLSMSRCDSAFFGK